MSTLDKYLGCFSGLAVGDAIGAPYEGGPLERLLWKIIGKTSSGKYKYTDDTQMAIDIARSFLHNQTIEQDHLAQSFASSYHWSRGYGPGAAVLLKKIRQGARWQDVNRLRHSEGSLGNGAAMRAPVIALCYPHSEVELKQAVVKCSEITHAHPLAIEGAQLVAYVTRGALLSWPLEQVLQSLPGQCDSEVYKQKINQALAFLQQSEDINVRAIRSQLGNGMMAPDSSVTALYFALQYHQQSLSTMLKQIQSLGGDVDTIGAMAGAVWGAFQGYRSLGTVVKQIENTEGIVDLAKQLYSAAFEQC